MQIHEAKRRNVAYNVYVTILGKIDELFNKVELLSQSLKQLDEKFENELLSMQRSTASSLVFEYDLSHKERVKINLTKLTVCSGYCFSQIVKTKSASRKIGKANINIMKNENLDPRSTNEKAYSFSSAA